MFSGERAEFGIVGDALGSLDGGALVKERRQIMPLWLLRPIHYKSQEDDLWDEPQEDDICNPWYDKAFGFVVRAETAEGARRIAAEKCGDEGEDAWLNAKYSTCTVLESAPNYLDATDCIAGLIMRDFRAS